jgi:Mrp family chromosome partitioning ATPase
MARAAQESRPRSTATGGAYLQAIWRRKLLVVAGAAVGLALGAMVLPRAGGPKATYQATVRLKVAQLVSDSVVPEQPQFASSGTQAAAGNALQDIVLVGQVLQRLGPEAAGLRPDEVVTKLTDSPVAGSPDVDLTYTDNDRARAGHLIFAYAKAWAGRRNAADAQRLGAAGRAVDREAADLGKQVADLAAVTAPTATQQAELGQARARLDGLTKLGNEIARRKLLQSSPTAVRGTPVTVQLSAPAPAGLAIVLGLLIGLIAGVGLALLVEANRPKVLEPADVERATGQPVVATIPRGRPGLPLRRRRRGGAAEEGYRRVAGALERRGLGEHVRVLAVASADPHEGKTLLVANLARVLARQGHDVVVVSGDLHRPKLDRLLDMAGEPGLAEWLEDGDPSGELPLRSVGDRLLLVPAGTSSERNAGELLTARRVREGLRPLGNAGFVVLIDTPPALWSAEALTLAAAADGTLLIARAGASRWRALEQVAQMLRRDGIRQLGTVLLGGRRKLLALSLADRHGLDYVGRHQAGAVREDGQAPARRAGAAAEVADAGLTRLPRPEGWPDTPPAPGTVRSKPGGGRPADRVR